MYQNNLLVFDWYTGQKCKEKYLPNYFFNVWSIEVVYTNSDILKPIAGLAILTTSCIPIHKHVLKNDPISVENNIRYPFKESLFSLAFIARLITEHAQIINDVLDVAKMTSHSRGYIVADAILNEIIHDYILVGSQLDDYNSDNIYDTEKWR